METIVLHPPKQGIKNAVIALEGSKSYTNRALVMAALAKGKSILVSPSNSDDSTILIQSLRDLGVSVVKNNTSIEVIGTGGIFKSQAKTINVGHAGTVMRFLTALSALIPGEITLDGSSRMRQRPIGELVGALQQLGINVDHLGDSGLPPLAVRGRTFKKNEVVISGKVSSQFITALLLISPCISGGLTIQISDEQISKSYIDMTIEGMNKFGVEVVNDHYKKYTVLPGKGYRATHYVVEGDASGSSYIFGIAAVSGATITVSNINPHSSQGDIHFVDILEQMGCIVIRNSAKNTITLTGPKKLKCISVNMESMPDTAQTLAVVAAFAEGTTRIGGLSTLKVKETDRLEATKKELNKIGITCTTTKDSLSITGGIPHSAEIETYNDHRMALAFSIVGSVVDGLVIGNRQVVNKSFPTYWDVIQKLGICTH